MTGNHAGHGTHACFPGLCPVMVPNSQLFCRSHWFMVPSHLRYAVNTTWKGGRGAGSEEHLAAMKDAMAFLKARLTPRGEEDNG